MKDAVIRTDTADAGIRNRNDSVPAPIREHPIARHDFPPVSSVPVYPLYHENCSRYLVCNSLSGRLARKAFICSRAA